MKLVFVHGWGSAPFVWNELKPHFDQYDCHFVNLGFIGEENIDIPKGKFIGIGHSLGGLWLLKNYPEQMSGFISIASFNCFHKHIGQNVLTKMQANVVKDTTAQIKYFWHHAGLDQPEGFMNLNPLKLIEGLKWLSKWESFPPKNLPVKILACRNDQIVPEEMTSDLWKDFSIEWINEGGHILPVTQSRWCTDHIKKFIDDVK